VRNRGFSSRQSHAASPGTPSTSHDDWIGRSFTGSSGGITKAACPVEISRSRRQTAVARKTSSRLMTRGGGGETDAVTHLISWGRHPFMASRSTRSRRIRRRRGLLREGFGGDGTSDRLGPQGSGKKACERAEGGASVITAPHVSGDERRGREG
jgi:hypothetical protein